MWVLIIIINIFRELIRKSWVEPPYQGKFISILEASALKLYRNNKYKYSTARHPHPLRTSLGRWVCPGVLSIVKFY